MTTPDDPVLRFFANEFASLRAQLATMTRQEQLALGSSLLAPALLLLYGLFLLIVPEATTSKPEERLYVSPADAKQLQPLPPALNPAKGPAPAPAVALSIVVPAYNEKLRLPQMLKDVHDFLAAPHRTRLEAYGAGIPADLEGWEIILVDDGSEDGTDLIALSVGHEWEKMGWANVGKGIGQGELRIVKLEANRGKGGAVKHGVLHSRGARVLFADADGASSFKSLATLQAALDSIEIPYPSAHSASAQASPIPGAEAESSAVETVAAEGLRHRNQKVNIQTVEPKAGVASEDKLERKLGIAIGSRAHLVSTDLVVKRSKIRNFLMHSFHLFVRTLGVRAIRDTQCGFKLFTRDAASLLFADMHLERWSFDVELLVLASSCTVQSKPSSLRAQSLPIPTTETPIDWTEIAGSKISLLWDSLGMARDLLVLRLCLGLTKWGVPRIILEQPDSK